MVEQLLLQIVIEKSDSIDISLFIQRGSKEFAFHYELSYNETEIYLLKRYSTVVFSGICLIARPFSQLANESGNIIPMNPLISTYLSIY
jgi:hypothetical protein